MKLELICFTLLPFMMMAFCVSQFVMQKMFISGTPLLESVGLWEPAVAELRERVRAALRQAAIPLRAYAREYERYLELHNSDIETFLK